METTRDHGLREGTRATGIYNMKKDSWRINCSGRRTAHAEGSQCQSGDGETTGDSRTR